MNTEIRSTVASWSTARTRPSAGATISGPTDRSGSRKKAKSPATPRPATSSRSPKPRERGSRSSAHSDASSSRTSAVAPNGRRAGAAITRAALRLEDDLDVDAVRDLDPHHLAEGPLVGVDVDQALV